MPTLLPNSFSSYKLSKEEQISGSILSTLQLCVLQNERAKIAEQKLGLIFNPINPIDFGLQQSFLEGQLVALQYLIDLSEEVSNVALINATSQPE